jgi:hypothetical protein
MTTNDTLTRHLGIMAEVLKIIAAEHRNGTLSPMADMMIATDIGFDVDYDDGERWLTIWRSQNSTGGPVILRGWLGEVLDPNGDHMMLYAI